jgi:hypothetical protein
MLGTGQVLLSAGANKVLQTGALSLSGSSKVDLSDNAMIVDYTGSSPLSTVGVWVKVGYANGSWTGDRLTSSSAAGQAASAHKTALGYAEASAIGLGAGSIFFDQTLTDSTAVLIRYTYSGDADLSGNVDTIDFNNLAANFGASGKAWSQGDFNYDSSVDTVDFNLLASNFGQTLPASSGPAGLGSLVPEPSAMMLLCIPMLLSSRRRVRRRA